MPRVHPLGAFQNNADASSPDKPSSLSQNSTSSVGGVSEPNKGLDSTLDFFPYLKEPEYSLEDVALPRETKHQLESVLAELKHQDLIYREWGMGKKHKLGKALSINFSGPPGTGKTLSAEATAHAFNLKILAVPYQLLESKYVGETPKNIAKAFEFATEHKAVLFFDEADSFLGKRLENVTQSSDTAVNLTRSVMLMQLSAYEGVVIFATNLIRNYDPAFISRIRWKIQFDLPDEEARAKIWQIQFPSQLPLDKSVNFNELAQRFDGVSGRDIQNAVFQAVVAAAKEDKPKEHKRVTQSHLMDVTTQIIEANKSASKPELVLKRLEGEAQLPPVSNA